VLGSDVDMQKILHPETLIAGGIDKKKVVHDTTVSKAINDLERD
jgi:hypothetical protein